MAGTRRLSIHLSVLQTSRVATARYKRPPFKKKKFLFFLPIFIIIKVCTAVCLFHQILKRIKIQTKGKDASNHVTLRPTDFEMPHSLAQLTLN